MDNDWVPIKFPTDIAEMLGEWLESDDGSVGLCLVCGESFGETDMISGTNFHNCPATSPPQWDLGFSARTRAGEE